MIIILQPLPAQSCIFSITLTSAPSDTIFLTIPGNILPLYFTATQFSSDKVPSSNDLLLANWNPSSDSLHHLHHVLPCSQFHQLVANFLHMSIFFQQCPDGLHFFQAQYLHFFFSFLVLGKILFSFLIINLRMFQTQGLGLLPFVEVFAESHLCWRGRFRLYKSLTYFDD